MNALAERVLGVAKEYLGPASQQFLSRELRALGCTADTLTNDHLAALSGRARASAVRIMDQTRAAEFADQLAALGSAAVPPAGPRAETARAGKADGPLAAAARLLADGKLRQAEEAYRQLAAGQGDVAAYQGLARASVALEDLPAAILALRDGAVALTRRGDRVGATRLLAEAVALAPGDLAAHRRLAAAQANGGDIESACLEYARFVDHAIAEGDPRRAWLELTYGRETLGDVPALLRIADRLMPAGPSAAAAGPAPVPVPPAVRTTLPPSPDLQRLVPGEPPAMRPIDPAEIPRTRGESAPSAVHVAGASTLTHVEVYEPPVDLLARTAPRGPAKAEPRRSARPALDLEALLLSPELTPELSGAAEQAAAVADVRATVLIGARDPRATAATLDAARRLLALHKLQAASDLLLDFIGAGYSDREAQRLLIEVDCGLGRRDVARDKCKLLGAAYRLDGRAETADDVERLAALL